ncbi:Rv3235 family protein [Actinospica sp.]|jgi:hypothetical protein|uniref:Rv3235 family protein n=1 Tax=Actinospica sp. TaxID=1872142 RepID=UPI002B6FAB7E|nr:Rv3235 family protein [Actinospica sp.]HWG27869.1 Rv3235 family protein [Actinospica sp.]
MLDDGTFFITEVNISDSGLQRVAGALADYGGTLPGQRGWLRSWVTGWTHCLDVDPLGMPQPEPIAGVGRLAEAVVDVLLERRPLEQMRRWLSRDVAGQLMPHPPTQQQPHGGGLAGGSGVGTTTRAAGTAPNSSIPSAIGFNGSPERRAPRFASRSMIRSVRLHQPAAGIVESTVVVQDGPRVRAVALRFEQSAPAPGRPGRPVGFDWLCTALQFN